MDLRISSALKKLSLKALSESMDIIKMTHMIRDIFPGYDIYERLGLHDGIAIPALNVAEQIIRDVIENGKFLQFVARLIHIQDKGLMGRGINISYIREVIKGTYELGYIYDTVNKHFVEDSRLRRTRNWGALESGNYYTIALLAIDIVGNTKLVNSNSAAVIDGTYNDLREIVSNIISKRNGRFWSWEGDGGLVAFYFGNKNMSAVLSAMEIIHRLFIYNQIECRLDGRLKVRIGVHSGEFEYTDNEEDLKKIDTVKEAMAIEKNAPAEGVSISVVVRVMLDEFVSRCFAAQKSDKDNCFSYSVKLE